MILELSERQRRLAEVERLKQNDWVRARYFAGESLAKVPAVTTHYPKRQAIPKDEGALNVLFGGGQKLPIDGQGEKCKILLLYPERSSDD
jgi:hypothetical protein